MPSPTVTIWATALLPMPMKAGRDHEAAHPVPRRTTSWPPTGSAFAMLYPQVETSTDGRPMSTLQIRTLRQFLESDQVIDCNCSNYWECTHSGPLRIEMAVQRLGWEFDFYAGRE